MGVCVCLCVSQNMHIDGFKVCLHVLCGVVCAQVLRLGVCVLLQ